MPKFIARLIYLLFRQYQPKVLSLSLLESMASGLPVITTPVGGLGDAVIDGL